MLKAGQEHFQLLEYLVLQNARASALEVHASCTLASFVKPIGNVCMLEVAQFLGLCPEGSVGGRLTLSAQQALRAHPPTVSSPCSLLSLCFLIPVSLPFILYT